MVPPIPAKLRAAAPDVQRFATRAAQLEKFRPIVTYWCEYSILQQILNRQLHVTDEECTQYALQLMDKLEAYKSANAENDAVMDDVAAKAYMENFALETFNKADEAQRSNKVTKQTADTFQASATFMDILSIWGQPDAEIHSKSKFAKFHALRIAKAIKAGEDPNATNPVIEQPPVPARSTEDDVEAELKNLENDAGVYKPPTVETIPDTGLPSSLPSTSQNEPFPPPTVSIQAPSAPPPAIDVDVSPIDSHGNGNSRAGSAGGGYFPSIPDVTANINSTASSDQLQQVPSAFTPSDPAEFYNQSEATAPTPGDLGIGSPNRPSRPTPHQMSAQPPAVPIPAFTSPPPQAQPIITGPPPSSYRTDDDSIMAAQKHAKWAISALNFEDVATAVKELQIALNSLGVS